MTILYGAGLAVSILLTLVVLIWLLVWGICALRSAAETREYNHYVNFSKVQITSWIRWLGHDFPVVDRVLSDLLKDVSDGAYRNMDSYRDELRREFKAKEGE